MPGGDASWRVPARTQATAMTLLLLALALGLAGLVALDLLRATRLSSLERRVTDLERRGPTVGTCGDGTVQDYCDLRPDRRLGV